MQQGTVGMIILAFLELITATTSSKVTTSLFNGSFTPPRTFGNGILSYIRNSTFTPVTVLHYTLSDDSAYGVMTHFWNTGERYGSDVIVVDYFVDDETLPSISFQPAMACGQGYPEENGSFGGNATFPPYGIFNAGEEMGKNGQVGGWYHYHKVLFTKSIHITARTLGGQQAAYIVVRGHEVAKSSFAAAGFKLSSGFTVPPYAKLQLHRIDNITYQSLSFVPVVDLPVGYAGLIYLTSFVTTTTPAGNDYIEGCWHLYTYAEQDFPGVVMGTGVEDYFDSAYWFCALSGQKPCLFAHPTSGLLHFSRIFPNGSAVPGAKPFPVGTRERLSAYRFFDKEVVGFSNGGSLKWRVGDTPGKCGDNTTKTPMGHPSPVAVRSYAWVYTWPLDPNKSPAPNDPPISCPDPVICGPPVPSIDSINHAHMPLPTYKDLEGFEATIFTQRF